MTTIEEAITNLTILFNHASRVPFIEYYTNEYEKDYEVFRTTASHYYHVIVRNNLNNTLCKALTFSECENALHDAENNLQKLYYYVFDREHLYIPMLNAKKDFKLYTEEIMKMYHKRIAELEFINDGVLFTSS
jgi:hypothetical protein